MKLKVQLIKFTDVILGTLPHYFEYLPETVTLERSFTEFYILYSPGGVFTLMIYTKTIVCII